MQSSEPEEMLRPIDDLLSDHRLRQKERAAVAEHMRRERERFVLSARHTLEQVVKPALVDIAERLRIDGGDGLVEEHPAEGRHGHRMMLWMSVDGLMVRAPRVDRNPYLQLEVDDAARQLTVWEGDMWDGLGASRKANPITLDELTAELVTTRAVDVLRRAVEHGADRAGESR